LHERDLVDKFQSGYRYWYSILNDCSVFIRPEAIPVGLLQNKQNKVSKLTDLGYSH